MLLLAALVGFCVGAAVAAVVVGASVRGRPASETDDTVTLVTALMPARTTAEVAKVAVDQARAAWGASAARLAVRRDGELFEYVADSLPADVHAEHAFFSLRGED